MIEIDREITQDYERALGLEWLETNGLGGWAGTTVAGAHSRREHGLLAAAAEPPSSRTVLLSRLDETLHVEGESFELSCNQFPGAVAPRGFERLTAFRQDLFPTFEFEAGGVRLRKTVAALDGENTTLVLYEVVQASGPFILSLRPFLAARDNGALTRADAGISPETLYEDGVLRLHPYPEVTDIFLQVPGAELRANPQWWYRFEYEGDRRRGHEFQEDLWTPGVFGRELTVGGRLGVVISTQDPAGRDAFALFAKERKRREKIVHSLPVQDDFARYLALAAGAFVVRRGPSKCAVIAGYPGASGAGERRRDALIALPGLCLVTGRYEDAKKILRAAVKNLQQGVLAETEDPAGAAADASLWLFVAAWKYLQATTDEALARETLLPALRKVVHWYEKGTLHGIGVDADGLLAAGPATARPGKAVEANALWFNALSILAELEARLGDPAEGKGLAQRAKRAQKSFQEAFWNESRGYLADCIEGDLQDAALCPRQIFALSLPFPLLPKPKAVRVLAAIEEGLYTPAGLRESTDPQGVVRTWLLGPYLTALVRVSGAAGRKRGLAAIEALKPKLAEAGVGSLAEGGSIAQACSVAEVLRAYVEDLHGGEEKAGRPARKVTVEAEAPKAPEKTVKASVKPAKEIREGKGKTLPRKKTR
jgi:predicted glycogen debranching enzyme